MCVHERGICICTSFSSFCPTPQPPGVTACLLALYNESTHTLSTPNLFCIICRYNKPIGAHKNVCLVEGHFLLNLTGFLPPLNVNHLITKNNHTFVDCTMGRVSLLCSRTDIFLCEYTRTHLFALVRYCQIQQYTPSLSDDTRIALP